MLLLLSLVALRSVASLDTLSFIQSSFDFASDCGALVNEFILSRSCGSVCDGVVIVAESWLLSLV